jgi:hypothetical protein
MTAIVSPTRKESFVRQTMNPPPAIEYYEDGLSDITQIHQDWETFKQQHENITCNTLSDHEFTVLPPTHTPPSTGTNEGHSYHSPNQSTFYPFKSSSLPSAQTHLPIPSHLHPSPHHPPTSTLKSKKNSHNINPLNHSSISLFPPYPVSAGVNSRPS